MEFFDNFSHVKKSEADEVETTVALTAPHSNVARIYTVIFSWMERENILGIYANRVRSVWENSQEKFENLLW